ncbi:type IV pilus twitching motility protein PilT [Desulfobaculum bizertense]|uniref:Twitching motility protein PilT n=1 Tax=Desulfobaculum bizertense DSM 18034 TaxID=1121442 RepID=A0A1T4W189_9BACT|nr:ATPase, T2SS/T4P/T4SS family [Desulfobaculum bizertense]SKA71003.1 twitching motility protein PilT [Desulfobaculum bizertense DSM 18034]
MAESCEAFLSRVVEAHPTASDIVLTVGRPVQVMQDKVFEDAACEGMITEGMSPLTPKSCEAFAMGLMKGRGTALQAYTTHGACDFSFSCGEIRFRANIFRQMGYPCVVLRRLPAQVPSAKDLLLPDIVTRLAALRRGLVLVTGAAGNGKSTSLAVLLEKINSERAVHIITLEDPVEYIYPQKRAVMSQRELGRDFSGFAEGLRSALRQSPQVLMVGEIRDRESLGITLQAAEAGLLVFATLHTTDAGQTLNRILGMFPSGEESFVRQRLAQSLAAVVSQRLCAKKGGGLVPAVEVLRSSLRIREAILQGELRDGVFRKILTESGSQGMCSMDQSVLFLHAKGLLTEESVFENATDVTAVRQELDRWRAKSGKSTSSLKGLTLDDDYEWSAF